MKELSKSETFARDAGIVVIAVLVFGAGYEVAVVRQPPDRPPVIITTPSEAPQANAGTEPAHEDKGTESVSPYARGATCADFIADTKRLGLIGFINEKYGRCWGLTDDNPKSPLDTAFVWRCADGYVAVYSQEKYYADSDEYGNLTAVPALYFSSATKWTPPGDGGPQISRPDADTETKERLTINGLHFVELVNGMTNTPALRLGQQYGPPQKIVSEHVAIYECSDSDVRIQFIDKPTILNDAKGHMRVAAEPCIYWAVKMTH